MPKVKEPVEEESQEVSIIVSAIVGRTLNGGIGFEGGIPWPRMPRDMKWFVKHTLGKAVIMGRKTWDSLPKKVRPLPNRLNVVMSRNPEGLSGAECLVAEDLDTALKLVADSNYYEAVVIGGQQIYDLAMPRVTRIYETVLEGIYPVDVFFPEQDYTSWNLLSNDRYEIDDKHSCAMNMRVYERFIF